MSSLFTCLHIWWVKLVPWVYKNHNESFPCVLHTERVYGMHGAVHTYFISTRTAYHTRGNFRGMKFLQNKKRTRFSWLYFHGSQVHCGKVARVMYCYKSLIVQTSNFHRLNFCCIHKWPWNPQNLHTAEISAHTVCSTTTGYLYRKKVSWFSSNNQVDILLVQNLSWFFAASYTTVELKFCCCKIKSIFCKFYKMSSQYFGAKNLSQIFSENQPMYNFDTNSAP